MTDFVKVCGLSAKKIKESEFDVKLIRPSGKKFLVFIQDNEYVAEDVETRDQISSSSLATLKEMLHKIP